MHWTVDRIEGSQAVCRSDGGVKKDLALGLLPRGVREGDVLAEDGGRFRADREETQRRRKAAEEEVRGLWG